MFLHPNLKHLWTTLFAASLLVASQTVQAARQSQVWLDRVSIIVNDEITTQSELEQRMQAARNNLRQRKIKLPPEAVLKRQLIDSLVLEQLQLQYAKKLGIDITDLQVDSAINNVARQNKLSRSEFLAKTRRNNVDLRALKQDIRRQLTIRELVRRAVERQIQVSESEIENFMADSNRRGASQEFNLSHIIISVLPGAPASARVAAAKKAESIRNKLVAGASFENLAITYSKGPNALKGGNLGWRQGGQLPDLFVDAISKISKGSITRVLESPNGFHILRINNSRGGSTPSMIKQTRARHILIKPSTIQSLKQSRATLVKLRRRIVAGENFAAVAKKYSNDTGSASQGGDLGWVSPGQLVGEIERAMNALKPGEISQPVQSRFGVHLVQVIGRRSKDVGKKRLRARARQQIHSRKADEKLQTWLQELRSQAYVEVLSD
ncbi:MAG: peptidylprolyl isomerase [Acidiferrobacterales bacterium]